jgi:hypothetical protein
MTDPNVPAESTPDATPTEALQLADQAPIVPEPTVAAAAPTPAPAAGRSHTRTILEVVGGVVAAGLIVVAGGVGFLVGHATSDDGRWSMNDTGRHAQVGPDAGEGLQGQQGYGQQGFGQQGQGQGMMPGQGLQGQDPRGIDPDGDNWTGQNQGQGMMPGQGLQGQDPRGIDPDGDNWTGQNQDLGSGQAQPTTPPQQG